ncbi:MAG: succinate CoA transferase [Bacteroidetes bacterium]|jgi:acetyl-CoA hydrolase|nr:succinate CoA transferase [Bacteroidota bacterium]
MPNKTSFPVLTPDEAAAQIPHGATVGFSGFTPAGSAKAVPEALAQRARALHEAGEPFKISVLTGASTASQLDDALADADAVSWRAPYQSSRKMRKDINNQQVQFLDMHLSHVPQMIEFGFIPQIDVAVVEATDVTTDGRVYLTTSVGVTPSILRHADKVIVEVNRHHSTRLWEMHDIAVLPPPPQRNPIPIHHPLSKMGTPFASVNPDKIIGIVETDAEDGVAPFSPPDEVSERIAGHVVEFLMNEKKAGRIPADFLPLQAGVGNVANAVMAGLGESEVPPFYMYTEVYQDALVDLMRKERLLGASTCSLTLSEPKLQEVYDNMDFFASRIVLRPQELSNNPGVVRRLGVISINTAIEVDIYGNVNSTHVTGTRLMNGIGGSGDFTRNAYLSMLVCPSQAKGGAISTVVPMVSHVDHNEHSVQIIATDQGLADLRGLGPMERARRIIDHCAHPKYRDYLHRYVEDAPMGHIRHDLHTCYELHRNLLEHGTMLPEG